MKFLISGSTGFVGSKLVSYLRNQGHEIYHLVTKSKKLNNEILWDPETGYIENEKIPSVDIVINLAGENISQNRWSDKVKDRILNSRLKSTKLIIAALSDKAITPQLWINASAIGYYGSTYEHLNTEEDQPGNQFLSDVCKSWEEEAFKAKSICKRVVILRFGVVLGKEGGVLKKLIPIFNLCAGGKLGNGKQYFAWISLDDLISIINHVINSNLDGIYNAVSPDVITNETFTKALGDALEKPSIMRIPSIVLRIKYGQMAKETMLQSCKASSQKLIQTGFEFKHKNIFLFLKNELNAGK